MHLQSAFIALEYNGKQSSTDYINAMNICLPATRNASLRHTIRINTAVNYDTLFAFICIISCSSLKKKNLFCLNSANGGAHTINKVWSDIKMFILKYPVFFIRWKKNAPLPSSSSYGSCKSASESVVELYRRKEALFATH